MSASEFNEEVIIHDSRWPNDDGIVWLLGSDHTEEWQGVKPIAELGLDAGSFVPITDIAQLVAIRDMIDRLIQELEKEGDR